MKASFSLTSAQLESNSDDWDYVHWYSCYIRTWCLCDNFLIYDLNISLVHPELLHSHKPCRDTPLCTLTILTLAIYLPVLIILSKIQFRLTCGNQFIWQEEGLYMIGKEERCECINGLWPKGLYGRFILIWSGQLIRSDTGIGKGPPWCSMSSTPSHCQALIQHKPLCRMANVDWPLPSLEANRQDVILILCICCINYPPSLGVSQVYRYLWQDQFESFHFISSESTEMQHSMLMTCYTPYTKELFSYKTKSLHWNEGSKKYLL